MKQTLITRLILGAFAGLAAVGAYAGQIQSSSTSVAREVITTEAQDINAPSIAYRFFGDIDASAQDQTFQVQFILTQGTWSTLPSADAISINDQIGGVVDQNIDYTIDTINSSADQKTLFVTITVLNAGLFTTNAGTKVIRQPLITLNTGVNKVGGVTGVTPATIGQVDHLFSVVGDIVNEYNTQGICGANKTIGVSFKHYTGLTAPTSIAGVGNGSEDESLRNGSTNALAAWLVFPTNIKVNFAQPANPNAILTTGGNLTFTQSPVAAYVAGDEYVSASTVYIGSISLAQNSTGYDANVTNTYVLAGVAGGANVNGLDAVTTAANNFGDVEVNTVNVAVKANNGFVTGGSLFLSTANDCSGPIGGTATVSTTGASAPGSVVTLVLPNASVNGAFGATGLGPVHICYTNPGNQTIPSSSFTAVGTVVKAAAGANLNEQNDICNGTLASVGGSLKIDVRNYASSAEPAWQSVIRVINPSDTMVADVWAQLINQDGTLGNYALLTTLPVRGIKNFTAVEIDALLAAGSAATAAPGTAAPVASGTTGAPRLRITSTSGNTLRVQNFVVNLATNQIIEASGSEAVDFAGTTNRAPVNEGQYQTQDAQSGLNLQ